MKPSAKYILQGTDEANRLYQQSELSAYDLATELAGLELVKGSKVLDLGCGAGCLIEYLETHFEIQGFAYDLLQSHVDYCKKRLPKRIVCRQHDILKAPPPGRYDHMFLRYVAHHLGRADLVSCLQNMRRALNPTGRVTCIDADGILINLGTMNSLLIDFIERIKANFSGDVEIARKLPSAFKNAGFAIESTHMQTIVFSGSARQDEVEQWRRRFKNAREAYTSMLGSDEDFQAFVDLYLSELGDESVPYYINKFVVTGKVD